MLHLSATHARPEKREKGVFGGREDFVLFCFLFFVFLRLKGIRENRD